MRRALAAALAVGVCSATLAGCTEDSPAGPTTVTSPGTTSRTPSTATTEPTKPTASTTTTEPASPVMPALAKKQSKAGAKAFVRHYADLINYSWGLPSTEALRKLANPRCEGCEAAADGIDEVSDEGGYKRGADWRPGAFFVVPLQPPREPIINVAIHISPGTFRESKDSQARRIEPAINRFDFHLKWAEGAWTITKLVTA